MYRGSYTGLKMWKLQKLITTTFSSYNVQTLCVILPPLRTPTAQIFGLTHDMVMKEKDVFIAIKHTVCESYEEEAFGVERE